jgi:16S rRNA (uracil1498-N3)-methyltransferase
MKFSPLSRIYINSELIEDQILNLDSHTHYINTVLRLKIGNRLRVFNNINGEFTAEIINITKGSVLIKLENSLRKPAIEPILILGLCLIKSDKLRDAINMAVQLGVTEIIPIIAERSQMRSINKERLQKCIIEAVEQSERLAVPSLGPLTLLQYFNILDSDLIFYANENETEENSLMQFQALPNKLSLIIGPEGGFTDSELNMLSSWQNSQSISLGPNILKTETAVAAGLAQLQLIRSNN